MTDTTMDKVPSPGPGVMPPPVGGGPGRPPRTPQVLAVVAIVVMAAIALSSLLPARWVAETENRRLEEDQPAPFARIPASAESVNDRVAFVDLPADVERFDPAGDFFFVTVSAPEQSLLSWFLGRSEPTVDLLTEEDKFGRRTPTQTRQIS
ncbi:MAG: hypothetical protein AAGG08_04465, partial [Actinomycetota bacterium]